MVDLGQKKVDLKKTHLFLLINLTANHPKKKAAFADSLYEL